VAHQNVIIVNPTDTRKIIAAIILDAFSVVKIASLTSVPKTDTVPPNVLFAQRITLLASRAAQLTKQLSRKKQSQKFPSQGL